jgi:aspartyl aminopeptidase
VKQNPLYENEDLAYLDTHYYGGIKKYQWVARQLALHGVVCKKDGTVVNVCIGEKDDDPVFAITDLLPHLGAAQMEKKANKVIEGENLDLLIGGAPILEDEKESVKANVLQILKDAYGVEEDDFLSAELEIVPAAKARDLGLDRSMVIAYGQDDRICAFTSLMAQLALEGTPKRTACCLLVDKEEIGSYGASGMQSRFFENMTAEVLALSGLPAAISLRRCLANSKMLSSDVNAAFDPLFPEVFEKKNTSFLGRGLVFTKFTGSRGKGSSSDANPEYIAKLRKIMDDNNVRFQTAELGKVDVGGGGTIAYITANYGMEVIDSGLAILCMHAPMEISSKTDIYEAYKGYQAFLKEME